MGEIITAALQDENFEVDARRCRERTMLLLDYYKKQDFPSLRRLVQSTEPVKLYTVLFPLSIMACIGGVSGLNKHKYTVTLLLVHSGLEQRDCTPRKRICSMKFWSWRLRGGSWSVVKAQSTRWVSCVVSTEERW